MRFFVLKFYNAFTEDFTMHHYVEFSQIGSQMISKLSNLLVICKKTFQKFKRLYSIEFAIAGLLV